MEGDLGGADSYYLNRLNVRIPGGGKKEIGKRMNMTGMDERERESELRRGMERERLES